MVKYGIPQIIYLWYIKQKQQNLLNVMMQINLMLFVIQSMMFNISCIIYNKFYDKCKGTVSKQIIFPLFLNAAQCWRKDETQKI